ncbi:MAG: cyclic nucleotide-binding domain-containing protein [Elusimicrobiota bacterium]
MTVTEFLRTQVPFLAGLTEDQALYLAKSSEQKPYRSGQTIIFKGVSVEGLHIVAQGKVSVHVKPEKKDWIKVAELGPGEVFGETSIMEFAMAGATIKSMKDDTLIFVIPQATFRKLLATDPDLEKRTVALIEQRKKSQTKMSEEKKAA